MGRLDPTQIQLAERFYFTPRFSEVCVSYTFLSGITKWRFKDVGGVTTGRPLRLRDDLDTIKIVVSVIINTTSTTIRK